MPKGTVIEYSSNKPLDSVLCRVTETGETVYTDSTGKYYLEGPFGGCVRDCRNMTVEFTKQGYESISVSNPGHQIIYLKN